MKYLNIEYNVKGLKPEATLKFEELILPYESEYFTNFIERYPEIDVSNINVILSDDVWRDINNFYTEHGHKQHKMRPKGLDHLVKIASVGDIQKIFWSATYINDLGIKVFFQVLIENLIGEHLKEKHGINKVFDVTSVRIITDQLLNIWFTHLITKNESSTIIPSEGILYDDMEELTFAFKKNIKELHFKYQKDHDNYSFINVILFEFEIYIRRVLSYRTENNLIGFDEFEDEINAIIKLLDNLNNDYSNLNDSIYEQNNKLILNLLKKCDVEIYDSKNFDNIGFKISEGPKMLFPDLIDTHPRIICFIDILGFKSLIEEYENKNTSIVLKKLKRVFDATRKAAFEILLNAFQKDVKEQLEFKMFSDCITVSLPYIEFGVDIKSGFHSMVIILNVLQQTFMREGFYLRGHITMGSYYADENMLFSGGLVEAYENESKTVYPAISVNNKIIAKLSEKTDYDDSLPSMNTLIVRHNFTTVNNQILNPFFTHDSIKSLENESDKILGGTFIGLRGNLKDAFQAQGIDLENELVNDLKAIKEKLIENYNDQLDIYENFDKSHKERTIASSVIDKYRFLNDLISWYQGNKDERFEYYLIE